MQVTESDVKWHPVITSDSVYIADKLLLVPWSQILVQIRDIFDRPYVTYYLYRTHLIAMSVILFSAEYEYMLYIICLLYTSPSPRDATLSRMPSSA